MKFLKLLCTFFILLFIAACGSDSSISSNSTTGDGSNVVNESYKVYFNSNDGDGYMLPLEFKNGESKQLTKNDFSRGGYIFKGWATSSDGSVVYYDQEIISISSDINLYAVWEVLPSYTITYHSNNGVDTIKQVTHFAPQAGNFFYLDANEFSNGESKFVGWSYSKDSDVLAYQDAGPVYELTSDIDLYAMWETNPVEITFDPRGGTGDVLVLYARAGDIIKIPPVDYHREGFLLKGAYTYNLKTYGVGVDFEVPAENVSFWTLWVELPKDPLPSFGGNNTKYKNTYVLFNGVNLKKSDWIESLTPGLYYGVWRPDAGWYDSSQWHYNLCWAGTASNIIHWWYDRNKENIDKYYKYYASEDALNIRPKTGYYGKGESDIFIIFRDHWADAGYKIEIGVEWFLFGSHYNKNGGGYLHEVLGEDSSSMIEFYPGITQYTFNTNINKAIEKGMMAGLAEVNGFGSHAISLWGVHYDDEGLIDGVFVSDSGTRSGNNAPTGMDTGMIYMNIIYDNNGKPFMTNDFGSRLPLTQLVLVSDGAELWKQYFDTHKPIR